MGVRLPASAPSFSVNDLRPIFLLASFPLSASSCALGGCRLLRIHRNVDLIGETDIRSRNLRYNSSALGNSRPPLHAPGAEHLQ
jgi:hypothetical protein